MGRILIGDNREQLATLPPKCVHCCVTSPPYFALRSYLPKDHPNKAKELGSERTPEEYLANQVDVFRVVRRVLRDDGVLFVNLGDSYNSGTSSPRKASPETTVGYWQNADVGCRVNVPGSKDGDLLNMPHRFALAMIADGWYHRDTIIWHKKSPMPSSQNGVRWEQCRVKVATHAQVSGQANRTTAPNLYYEAYRPDKQAIWQPCPGCPKCLPNNGLILRRGRFRTTTAHEYIFVFAKSKLYFMDAEQSREKALNTCTGRTAGRKADDAIEGEVRANGSMGSQILGIGIETRIPRSVMTFPSEPYGKSHFATYPSSLPRFAIEMATSAYGCCPACGAQYAPIVEKERVPTRPGLDNAIDESGLSNRDPERHVLRINVIGHKATCKCEAGDPVPCVVLDPYGGSGTTAQAANAMGRDFILCELNEAYVDHERINKVPKWAIPKPAPKRKLVLPVQFVMPLFDFLEREA